MPRKRNPHPSLCLLLCVFAGVAPRAFAVIDPIESTRGQQLYTCDYMLRGIGTLISEAPVDAMGFDFRMEFIKLIPLIEDHADLLDITDAVIRKRLEIASKYKTQFASQMADLGQARLSGESPHAIVMGTHPDDSHSQKLLTHLSRYLGPPTDISRNVDLSPFQTLPFFTQQSAETKVWRISGRAFEFEIYSPSAGVYYFQHVQAKDIPKFLQEAVQLWNRAQDWSLTTNDRVEALARFEWLWYWMNPYGRSAALTGDVASLVVQHRMVLAGDKILVREEYQPQNLEALVRDEQDYVTNRIVQLTPDQFKGQLQMPSMAFRPSRNDATWEWLKNIDAGGSRILDFLSTDDHIRKLSEHDSGVKENLTVREHTLLVFDQYYEQRPYYDFDSIRLKYGIDMRAMLPFVIAVHDLAKPFAVVAGDRALQHQSVPMLLSSLMSRLGFAKQETAFAIELITDHSIGELLQDRPGNSPASEPLRIHLAALGIAQSAARVGMDVLDYFEVLKFFYICDTSSYPYLRNSIFHPRKYAVSAKLELKSPRLKLLQDELEKLPPEAP